jgi:predicted tellurium resistance membrane protein TerC
MTVSALDWLVLLGTVVILFAVDLTVATLRPHAVGFREATLWSVVFVAVAVGFAFIGVKLILHWAHGLWHGTPEISTSLSLAVIGGVLVITTVASLIKVRRDPSARAHAGAVIGSKPQAEDHETPD